MENYPLLKEFALENETDDVESSRYLGFFTTKQINLIAEDFSYKEEIFNISLQLGISHSVSVHLRSRYDNHLSYAVDVFLLWRETYNVGDFEACRKLDSVLRDAGLGRKAAVLVSEFLKWVNSHVCCRNIVEGNAKYAITKLSKSKKSTGLRETVVKKFAKWCRQQRLTNNEFNMSLYFQLFGLQLYENEQEYLQPFQTILSYLNTSMKHHLPHDAFYMTVVTVLDMENNVAISSSYMPKEITEFLHARRIAKICDNLPNMEIVSQLAHSLDIPDKILRRTEHRYPDSLYLIAYDILNAWKQDCPYLAEEDKVQCLTEALEEIDMNKLAFEIKEEFQAWQMSPNSEYEICFCEIKSKKRPLSVLCGVEETPPKSTRTDM